MFGIIPVHLKLNAILKLQRAGVKIPMPLIDSRTACQSSITFKETLDVMNGDRVSLTPDQKTVKRNGGQIRGFLTSITTLQYILSALTGPLQDYCYCFRI